MNEDYYRFTGPLRLEKAVHSLEGLLHGISVDGDIEQSELALLTDWIDEHSEDASRHPFNEIVPRLRQALSDGLLDDEELQDLLWLCGQMKRDKPYFDAVTADMQTLQAMMAGVAADGRITAEELRGLARWMEDRQHLRTCWPFDELESLIVEVLKDGKVLQEEHSLLLIFFKEFLSLHSHKAIQWPINEVTVPITGICALCPEVIFESRLFCFTGEFRKCDRSELECLVSRHGGQCSPRVNGQINYLVVGSQGNPCWAFACYGRKIEQAVQLRKQGNPILIVHENDFWDCVPAS